jgi:hypothetical protein
MTDDWAKAIDCTGDVVVGDTIRFREAIFDGPFHRTRSRNQKPDGHRTIIAKVVADSYGQGKQQHTFTLDVIDCETDHEAILGKTLRKGRNIYRNGCVRLPWPDESERRKAADEKHERGDAARRERDQRIADKIDGYDRDDTGESPDY